MIIGGQTVRTANGLLGRGASTGAIETRAWRIAGGGCRAASLPFGLHSPQDRPRGLARDRGADIRFEPADRLRRAAAHQAVNRPGGIPQFGQGGLDLTDGAPVRFYLLALFRAGLCTVSLRLAFLLLFGEFIDDVDARYNVIEVERIPR